MISVMLAAAVVAALALVGTLRRDGPLTRAELLATLRYGAWIALVRTVVFGVGLALYGYADVRQVVGYAILVTNTLVETAVLGYFRPSGPFSPVLVGLLLIPTSLGLALLWTLISRRRARP